VTDYGKEFKCGNAVTNDENQKPKQHK